MERSEVDYIEITDGDGTNLGTFTRNEGDLTRTNIRSNTESVHVLFHTDDSITRRGWSLEWSKYTEKNLFL